MTRQIRNVRLKPIFVHVPELSLTSTIHEILHVSEADRQGGISVRRASQFLYKRKMNIVIITS